METSISSPTPDVLLAQARFVSALARDLLSDAHAAEDLAQETWLRFLRRPPRTEGSSRGWLRAVTSRLAVEGLRGRSRRGAREERVAHAEALPSVADELAHTEILRSVAEAVLALEEPYRTTVLLAYWRGWDAHRIARETATPLATVRSRLQRAHLTLRERLDRRHGREAWALALSSLPTVQASGALAFGALLVVGLLVAGAFILRSLANGHEPLELVSAASATPEPGREVPRPLERIAEPTPAARSELGAAPSVLRIAGTVADLSCAELELAARASAGLELKVRLEDTEYSHSRAPLAEVSTRTDGEGRFAVELPRPTVEGAFVRVSADADASYRRLWYRSELARAPSELVLARAPHGVLHGRVLDERGTPLAGVGLDLALDGGELAVSSGDEGDFAIPNAQRLRGVKLRSSLQALLGWEGARSLEGGGFTPLVVRLGPAARLRLEVKDRGGAGIAGVKVRAHLPECEQASIGMNADERALAGETGDDGVVLLEGLWAGRKLRFQLESGSESFTSEAMEAGRLRLASLASEGRPIVIEPGAELALEARLDVERDVAGIVRFPDGTPAAKARVEVTDLGRGDAWRRPTLLELESDGAGRFAGRLRTAEIVGPLRITASAPAHEPALGGKETEALRALGYAGPRAVPDVDALDMPAARVDLAASAEALAGLELVLGPRHAIRGTLLGRDGAPVARFGMGGSRVWAVPVGSTYHGHGVQARGFRGRPGAFEIRGLEPGLYDVCVSEELESFYTFENFLHRFPALEAGSTVELRLPERREVRIRVRLVGGTPSSTIVMHRKLFPAGPFDAPRAQPVERVSGARGWPRGAAFGFTGIGGAAIEFGATSDGFDEFEGLEHALELVEAGFYVVGVHAAGREGEAGFFPQATPLSWFGEGEHVVEFELLPAATLRGRVVGDTAGSSWPWHWWTRTARSCRSHRSTASPTRCTWSTRAPAASSRCTTHRRAPSDSGPGHARSSSAGSSGVRCR